MTEPRHRGQLAHSVPHHNHCADPDCDFPAPAPAGLLREAAGVLEVEHVTLRGPSHDVRGQDRLSGYCETCRIIDALDATGDSASPDRAGLREAAEAFLDWYDSPRRSYQRDGTEQRVVADLRTALAATGDSGGPPTAWLTNLRDTSPDPNTRSAANFILAGLALEADHD